MDKKTMMDDLVRAAYEKGGFTGTWLYAENGEILSKGAVGFRDPEDKLPLREDSVFDLASVSKQFTAAAVMLLRRRGLLALDDEITKYFPEIPYKGVTIRHLLNHTGGLPDYMEWVDKIAKAENTIPGNDIIVRFLCEWGEEAEFAPGEQWEYSNTGYCLLAQIAEKAAGVPFEDFLRENIFEPAGMRSTRVYHRRKDKLAIDNLAYGLSLPLGSDRYVLPDDEAEESEAVTCDGMNGDGLVHSNILDLFAWDRALRNETVLTKEEQALMYTPGRLNNGEPAVDIDEDEGINCFYGFGWNVLNDPDLGLVVCHSGGWPGYSTWYERFVDADRVLIRLRCRDARDERAYEALSKGMTAIVRDREPDPVRSIEELAVKNPDKTRWEAFVGKYDYAIGDFRIEEILMNGGGLYAKTSYHGKPVELRLYPLGENTFGIKDVDADITFGDGTLTMYGKTGKKLKKKKDKKESVLRLEKIDAKNVWDVLDMKVKKGQKSFVAANDVSIIQAYTSNGTGCCAFPFAIYRGKKPVGFLMIGYNEGALYEFYEEEPPASLKNNYSLWRLMIDKKYQHRGYGREAIRLALEFIRTWPCGEAELCSLSYEPENDVAAKLYHSFGFAENGEMDGDEIVAVLKL